MRALLNTVGKDEIMFGPQEGSWSLTSKTDPRWNCDGRSSCCGGFIMPNECKQRIEELKKILGEPPKDLEWAYMKD